MSNFKRRTYEWAPDFIGPERPTLTDHGDARWRYAAFVSVSADWGDRGRMIGSNRSPAATLHRPSCAMLHRDRRNAAVNPAHVYETTELDFFKRRPGSVQRELRICSKCCKDIKLGRKQAA